MASRVEIENFKQGTAKMKSKFLAIISRAEDWDGKPTPNVSVSTEEYETPEELKKAIGSLISRYSDPKIGTLDMVSYLTNSVDLKWVEPPVEGHHTMPIKVAIRVELMILTKKGNIVPMSWLDCKAIKDEID